MSIEKSVKKRKAIAIPQIKTLEEADAHQRKHGFKGFKISQEPVVKPKKLRGEPPKMNATEREFEVLLLAQKSAKLFLEFQFQGIRLAWGDCMVYKPDFNVQQHNGRIKLIEVKGAHIWDRDIVRFKGCKAEWKQWFDFEMWQRDENKSWNRIL